MSNISPNQFSTVDLSGRTPPDIDAEWWEKASKAQPHFAAIANARRTKGRYVKGGYREAPSHLDDTIAYHQGKVDEITRETQPYADEYQRRGRWSRHFIVNNTDGHVHRADAGCRTLHPTTSVSYLPDLSGKNESDVVGAVGERACTVCFPSAPTHPAWQAGMKEAQKAAEAKESSKCKASGSYGRAVLRKQEKAGDYNPRMMSPRTRCPECGAGVSVTSTGKLKAHKPGGGKP